MQRGRYISSAAGNRAPVMRFVLLLAPTGAGAATPVPAMAQQHRHESLGPQARSKPAPPLARSGNTGNTGNAAKTDKPATWRALRAPPHPTRSSAESAQAAQAAEPAESLLLTGTTAASFGAQ